MNNGRSNTNLMEELEGRQMALMHLNSTGGRQDYKNFHRKQIRGIERELNRRAALKRNKAKGHWKALGKHVGARGIVGYMQRRTMRPPNTNTGGAGYRRMMRQTNVGKKRTRSVGTSMSPNRRSPKRRNAGTSP